jgi:arsenate reductase-like glutaredoxin family protein
MLKSAQEITMERTVPIRSSEEIELYLRTIYSLLRSSNEVHIRSLEEVHAGMNSSLHTLARENKVDVSAFVYSLLRLPDCVFETQKFVLGQTASNFVHFGYGHIEEWQEVSAKARRRRCFYNGKDTLACFIASRSDIDDVVPTLTAFQIEWNKLHNILGGVPKKIINAATPSKAETFHALSDKLGITEEELARLYSATGNNFKHILQTIADKRADFTVQLLSGSLNDYRQATEHWWEAIESHYPDILERPVYFISSNTHSIPNLLSGFALQHTRLLDEFVANSGQAELQAERAEIKTKGSKGSQENFYYYLMKKLQNDPVGKGLLVEQALAEQNAGIERIPSIHAFDVEAEVIDIRRLDFTHFDPRLLDKLCKPGSDCSYLQKSDALIINIDYPLGFAAYHLLSKIAENINSLLGIYVMGKAASLNGVRGDVILPNVVYDEHSRNTYLLNNNFTASDIAPWLNYGTVLDNQKAVSVMGTYLQNATVMDVIYREGYTDVEMEAGPYLSAVYELFRPQRHPVNEIVNLTKLPFDLGVLHYVSDTPLSKGRNLGAGSLSYYGMDSTYAVSIAILRRIFSLEKERLQEQK